MKSQVRGLIANFILLIIGMIIWYEAIFSQGLHLSSLERIVGWLFVSAVIIQYTFSWKLNQQEKTPWGHPWLGIILLLISLYLLILGYNIKI